MNQSMHTCSKLEPSLKAAYWLVELCLVRNNLLGRDRLNRVDTDCFTSAILARRDGRELGLLYRQL
jgi:hypothetical protein